MGKRDTLTAHSLVRPAVESLLERIAADAERVVRARDDEEAVHDFRVGLRRLRTIMRASRALYGKSKVKRIERSAKAFGDATNALRDAEVLAETLRAAILDNRGQIVSAAWLKEVSAGEDQLRAATVELLSGKDLEALCRATRSILREGPLADPRVADFAEERFAEVRDGVRALLPVAGHEVEHLHRLRIRFKRLRYTSEMLAQFMTVIDATGARKSTRAHAHQASGRFASVARAAARMQKELGLLHDADQALEALAGADMAERDRASIETALSDLRRRLVSRSLSHLAALPEHIVGAASPIAEGQVPR